MNEQEEKKGVSTAIAGGEQPPTGKPDPKGGWRGYLGSRNKDLNLDDDEAVSGYLKGEFDRLDKSDETNKRMNELIAGDKRNAGFLSGYFSGKGEDGEDFDLTTYLATNWYDELKASTDSEDLVKRLNDKMAKEEKEAAEAAERSKTIEENFQRMNEALKAAIDKTGVDAATAQKMLDWLYGTDEEEGMYLRIPKRNVNEDDFVKLIYAFTRDNELDKARTEGRTEGRRQRPGSVHRSAQMAGNTDLGGGSATPEEEQEQNPTAARYGGMRPRFA